MGILYSHIVFQPPSPPSYQDLNGAFRFRHPDHDNPDDHNPDNYITHPLLYLTTSHGNTLPAVYFHHPHSHYTILFSHGNAEDLGHTATYAYALSAALRTSVLCYDYSGYGLSTGKPTEATLYADIRAAYNYLVSHRRLSPRRILLFGRSLGSGPTVDLAAALGTHLAGVVLIAPLASCIRVVFPNVPCTPSFDMFPNIDKIDAIRVPLCCVHGTLDDVVPFSHGLQLARRARFSLQPLWIRGAGHNNLEGARFRYEVFLRYIKALHEFRRWQPPQAADEQHTPVAKRHESVATLGNVAACFGRGEEGHGGKGVSKRWRRSGSGMTSSSMSRLFLRKRFSFKATHEVDRKMGWSADAEGDDETRSVLSRRSSEATFGSRSMFDDHQAKALTRNESRASLSSSSLPKIAAVT